MNKKKFLEIINIIEDLIIRTPRFGLCSHIEDDFSLREGKKEYCYIFRGDLTVARITFNKYFSPDENRFAVIKWLGDEFTQNYLNPLGDNMTELERRLMFLECFKQWALCYKEYERF